MNLILLALVLTVDPDSAPSASQRIIRAGVDCAAAVDSLTIPLIGEVHLTLSASSDASFVVAPINFRAPDSWKIRAVETATTEVVGNRHHWKQTFRLSPERSGQVPIRPPSLSILIGGRETPVDIDFRPFPMVITTSLERATLDEARGVTGPEQSPKTAPFWHNGLVWAVVIGILALIAAVWAGRRSSPPPMAEPEPAQWAFTALDRIDPNNPVSRDLPAKILREFLDRTFGFAASGTTTRETLTRLEARELPADLVARWKSLLERCDVARFADLQVSSFEWQDLLDQSRQTIAATLRVIEPADSRSAVTVAEGA